MSDDKNVKATSGFLAALLSLIPVEFRSFVGFVLGLAVLYAVVYALIFMPTYLKNVVESNSKASEFCWELREIQKIIFKFNKCTGEAVQVEMKSSQTAAQTKSALQSK